MRRLIVLLAIAAAGGIALAAHAQNATTPESENGRYTFSQVADGTLRLDTRTGQVSLCTKKPEGLACATVPDERAALDAEIARLQRENGALKKELVARGIALPNDVTGLPSAGEQRELHLTVPLPSDSDIDRAMSAFEKIWRRLRDIVQSTPTGDRI